MVKDPPRELVVLHYHFRPGGVRRVIELLVPPLAGRFEKVTLLAGEAPDREWEEGLRRSVPGARIAIHPAINYFIPGRSDPGVVRDEVRRALQREAGPQALIWAHNLALGRNLLLADEVAAHSAAAGVRLLSHHHDFWCDQRWARWPEIRKSGFRSLSRAAQAVFAAGARVVHAGINSADARLLAGHLPATAWLPNPIDPSPRPLPSGIRAARDWLTSQLGDASPVWIYPARLLRRKNLAEAILLTRWLNPDGWLVTTGGVSSPAESEYARRLSAACEAGGWRVRLSLLERAGGRRPGLPDLMAASEALVMTSLQEGFGFPYLEGAGLGCRMLARRIPIVQPDLDALGVHLPGLYHDVMIPPGLFDSGAEVARQKALFRQWTRQLPSAARAMAGRPLLLGRSSRAVAFSRLTIDAQLEVLSQPPGETLRRCRRLNAEIFEAFAAARAQPPEGAFLSPGECAERLLGVRFDARPPSTSQAASAQLALIRERTASRFVFPVLMQE